MKRWSASFPIAVTFFWLLFKAQQYFFGPASTEIAFPLAAAVLWTVWQRLDETRRRLAELERKFFIADAELVRVSALAFELEDKLGDLEIKFGELDGRTMFGYQ